MASRGIACAYPAKTISREATIEITGEPESDRSPIVSDDRLK
jgi:hypothetical protein